MSYLDRAKDEEVQGVISNGMVDAKRLLQLRRRAECGINERVSFAELREILEADRRCGGAEGAAAQEPRQADPPSTVTVDDIFCLHQLSERSGHGIGTTDDIDHLGNRRIRSVGELLQNQFRIGFSRMERVIRERMTLQAQDLEVITPQSADQHPPGGGGHQGVLRLLARCPSSWTRTTRWLS